VDAPFELPKVVLKRELALETQAPEADVVRLRGCASGLEYFESAEDWFERMEVPQSAQHTLEVFEEPGSREEEDDESSCRR
jgi:hypothetical protein